MDGNFVALTDENPAATKLEKIRKLQAVDTEEHERIRREVVEKLSRKNGTANENELEDILSVKP